MGKQCPGCSKQGNYVLSQYLHGSVFLSKLSTTDSLSLLSFFSAGNIRRHTLYFLNQAMRSLQSFLSIYPNLNTLRNPDKKENIALGYDINCFSPGPGDCKKLLSSQCLMEMQSLIRLIK